MSSYRDDFREREKDVAWSAPRVVGWILLALVALFALSFIVTGGDLAIYRFWAPKQADAQRVVFENTQSYVQGKTEYISRLRYQYLEAEKGSPHKGALKQLILSEAATVDNSKLPVELESFIQQLKGSV